MASSAGVKPQPANVIAGAAYIVSGFFFVAVMSSFGKAAAGMSITMLTFSQTFISWLLFLPAILHGGLAQLKTPHLTLYIVRSLAGLLSQVFTFLAVQRLPLLEAVLLSNSAPLFIPLIARIWLKEKIAGATMVSLIVGFVGVVITLRPGPALWHNPASLLGICAAFFSALGLVAVNLLSKTEPSRNVLFYYFLISSLISAPFVVVSWQTPHLPQLGLLLGIGLCLAASQFLIILAYREADASRIAPFNFSVVLFSGLIGWIFWHQQPSALAYLGAALIGTGGIISTIWGGPNSRGHLLWLGNWNHVFSRRTAKFI